MDGPYHERWRPYRYQLSEVRAKSATATTLRTHSGWRSTDNRTWRKIDAPISTGRIASAGNVSTTLTKP
jgi:hypothetical protein